MTLNGVIMRSTDAAAKFVIIVAINALASVRSLINSIFVVIIRRELFLFLASRYWVSERLLLYSQVECVAVLAPFRASSTVKM